MDLKNIKADLTQLVLAGRKQEAIKLLREHYPVSEEEAERLLQLAVKESVNPALLVRTIAGRLGGRGLIFKMVAFGMGFMGIPMALMFVGLLVFDQIRVAGSMSIEGVVTDLEAMSYDDPRTRPIIQYAFDTETLTTRGSTYTSPPAFKIGDAVPLLVNTKDPADVVIDTFSERWLGVSILGVVSTIFLVLMAVFIRLARRQT